MRCDYQWRWRLVFEGGMALVELGSRLGADRSAQRADPGDPDRGRGADAGRVDLIPNTASDEPLVGRSFHPSPCLGHTIHARCGALPT